MNGGAANSCACAFPGVPVSVHAIVEGSVANGVAVLAPLGASVRVVPVGDRCVAELPDVIAISAVIGASFEVARAVACCNTNLSGKQGTD